MKDEKESKPTRGLNTNWRRPLRLQKVQRESQEGSYRVMQSNSCAISLLLAAHLKYWVCEFGFNLCTHVYSRKQIHPFSTCLFVCLRCCMFCACDCVCRI